MGFTRIIQAGNQLEIYEYEKPYIQPNKRKQITLLEKKRIADRKALQLPKSETQIKRTKREFFRRVKANLEREEELSFLTLTTFQGFSLEEGYEAIRHFKENVKNTLGIIITYIAVPEWQKRSGNLHYHLLVWGIPKKTIEKERSGRILQRLYGRGYLDIRLAKKRSPKIASYLAKYMAKAYADKRLSGRRAYSASRLVYKPRTVGTNSLSTYLKDIIPVDSRIDRVMSYDTLWLGRCEYTRYITTQKNENHRKKV